MPKIDFKFYFPCYILLTVSLIFLIVGNFYIPIETVEKADNIENIIEFFQVVIIIAMGIYTLYYVKEVDIDNDKKNFWRWSVSVWALVLTRELSWGREIFPNLLSHQSYHWIGVIFIFIFILCSIIFPVIIKEIRRRWKQDFIPFWYVLFAILFFVIVDIVEHQRVGFSFFVVSVERTGIIEELMETSMYLSLSLMAIYLQKKDLIHYK